MEYKSVREVFSADQISLTDIFKLFYEQRKYLYITLGVCLVFGILIALTSPVEYTSQSRILPEANDSKGSQMSALSGLAGLAGINLPQGGGVSGFSTSMYPDIIASQPFLLDLMAEKFYFEELDQEMSLREYFSNRKSGHIFSSVFGFLTGIPKRIIKLLERKKEWNSTGKTAVSTDSVTTEKNGYTPPLRLTGSDLSVMNQLVGRILIESTGSVITLQVQMPEPLVSAELNRVVLAKIVDYVVAYKTDKQRQNLGFINDRYLEAKDNFVEAQLRLASFQDANRQIITNKAKAREDQLRAEFNLAFDIYSSLAKQLEQARIEVKQETPLFTEFEPVTIPLSNSKPNVTLILIVWFVLGIFFGIGVIFLRIVRSYYASPK